MLSCLSYLLPASARQGGDLGIPPVEFISRVRCSLHGGGVGGWGVLPRGTTATCSQTSTCRTCSGRSARPFSRPASPPPTSVIPIRTSLATPRPTNTVSHTTPRDTRGTARCCSPSHLQSPRLLPFPLWNPSRTALLMGEITIRRS